MDIQTTCRAVLIASGAQAIPRSCPIHGFGPCPPVAPVKEPLTTAEAATIQQNLTVPPAAAVAAGTINTSDFCKLVEACRPYGDEGMRAHKRLVAHIDAHTAAARQQAREEGKGPLIQELAGLRRSYSDQIARGDRLEQQLAARNEENERLQAQLAQCVADSSKWAALAGANARLLEIKEARENRAARLDIATPAAAGTAVPMPDIWTLIRSYADAYAEYQHSTERHLAKQQRENVEDAKAELEAAMNARAEEARRNTAVELHTVTARYERAVRALKRAGFEDVGGQEWKPPIGPQPRFIEVPAQRTAGGDAVGYLVKRVRPYNYLFPNDEQWVFEWPAEAEAIKINTERRRYGVDTFEFRPLFEQPVPEAAAQADDWKDRLYAAMDAAFKLHESGPRDTDGQRQGMRKDDTQIGVEFAMDWFEKSILSAAPTVQVGAEHEKAMADAAYWGTGMMRGGRHVPYANLFPDAAPTAQPTPIINEFGRADYRAGVEAAQPTLPDDERGAWSFKQWWGHVGAWETAEGFISFGSPMAVRAMLIQYGRMIEVRAALRQPGRPAAAPFDIFAHLQRQADWSRATFGPGPRTKGVCDHIRKELLEIEADPLDLREWIDVVILALDGAWRCGGSPQQIVDGIVAKQTKNEGRVWPDWRTADPDKAIEHDRSHDGAAQRAEEKS